MDQKILLTSLVWFILLVIVAFVAYQQGEAHVVHCLVTLGTEC